MDYVKCYSLGDGYKFGLELGQVYPKSLFLLVAKECMSLGLDRPIYVNEKPKHLVDSCGMDKLVSSLNKKEK